MSKGRIFIISGPSGSGKDTLLKNLFEIYPQMKFSISSITRAMREGEIEGEKYNFISREAFIDMINNDALLEHNEFVGNFYGTPKAPVLAAIDSGDDIIIEVDVNGAAQIREKMPQAISIFVMPPSLEILKSRLRARGTETEEVLNKRLNTALDEIRRADEYDYIIVNDVLSKAVDDITTVINSEKFKLDRQHHLIKEILDKA